MACGLDVVRSQIERGLLPRLDERREILEEDVHGHLPPVTYFPSHSHPDEVPLESSDSSEKAPRGTRFGRYSLGQLLSHFSLIYGTDTVWDGINRVHMRLSALRHVIGRDLYKEWDGNALRKVARGLVFEPSGELPPDTINTFDRLPLAPAPNPGGEGCQKILGHVRRLCGDREDEYWWLLKWIAYPLQHLGAKMDTSVIMYGSEGPGKSVLWEQGGIS